ncbi:MAG: acetate--CoA ligase family protein, partial [Candidatus Krumholzibacteria bacterium]|nr:acetate--CoA ligase family protein [Candidatus Krumholzibacteria bacterium]
VLGYRLATNEADCMRFAEEIGYPVALKIVSPDILHKVDVGGVRVNIRNREELEKACQEMRRCVNKMEPEADVWGILVQQMAEKGKETIIGMNRDPDFGAMLVFGMGGVYVEALRDVTFRLAPIRESNAQHMVRSIRGHRILEGVRGEKPSDVGAIVECLQRLSQLVNDFEEITELDINPFIVFDKGKGAKVIDARILIGER